MTDKKLIKAEIERLQKKYYQRGEESDALHDGYGMYWGGVFSCLNEIDTFINSLPEEPVSEELEDAALAYCNSNWKLKESLDAFKAGAQWQKKRLISKACEWLADRVAHDSIDYPMANKYLVEDFRKAM